MKLHYPLYITLAAALALVPVATFADDDYKNSGSFESETQMHGSMGTGETDVHTSVHVEVHDDGSVSTETHSENKEQNEESNSDSDTAGMQERHQEAEQEMEQHMEQEMEHGLLGGAVSIQAQTVRGWDEQEKNDFLSSVKAALEVKTEGDLEQFAQGVLVRDEKAEHVATSDDKVSVTYNMPAKLFGIFDFSIPVTATVRAAGSATSTQERTEAQVQVQTPWFLRMFSTMPTPANEGNLQTSISGEVGTTASTTSFTLSTQAQLAEKIAAALRAAFGVAVGGE